MSNAVLEDSCWDMAMSKDVRCLFIANQVVKVEIQKSKFEGIHKVIFVSDQFATGGELVFSEICHNAVIQYFV